MKSKVVGASSFTWFRKSEEPLFLGRDRRRKDRSFIISNLKTIDSCSVTNLAFDKMIFEEI